MEEGYRIKLGAELEYGLHYKGSPPSTANRQKIETAFPHSRLVKYCYFESGKTHAIGNNPSMQQMEAVLDHTHGLGADRVADAIASLQKEVIGSTHHLVPPASKAPQPIAHIARLRKEAEAKQRSSGIVGVTLASSLQSMTNGLHLNVSLHTADENGVRVPLDRLCETTQELFLNEQKLLVTNPSEYTRWLMEVGDLDCVKNRASYVENKMPAATNSPHVAVLMQLAAVYVCLHADEFGSEPMRLAAVLGKTMPEKAEAVIGAAKVLAQQDRSFCHRIER